MEELDLKEIFNMFWTRKVQIILITLIFVVIGTIYSYIFVSPVYTSYTSLVLATAENTNKDTITTSDVTLNNNLVSTYSEIVTSETVLGEVINNLGISKSYGSLKKAVSVNSVKGTQIIRINVTDSNNTEAKLIADEIAKVFMVKVSEFYKINNIHIVDEAKVSNRPSNINHIKDIAMFAFVGLVLSCIYVIIANMLDTTVKTEEDVEKKLGLTVLTTIPITNFDELTRTGKGGRK